MRVTRTVELDLSQAAAWQLIATSQGWLKWLATDVAIEVVPGAVGAVVDDALRTVMITAVDEGRSVSFSWADAATGASGGGGELSHVRLELDAVADGGVRLTITEELAASSRTAPAALAAWELRVTCLWAVCVAAALV